jgi:crotonobetainyl-CoA:carnitine CoA-transferase CaiB-like acyl-CoA transferase
MSITITQDKYRFKPVTLVIDSENDLELVIEALKALQFTERTGNSTYFNCGSIDGTARRAEVIRLVRRLEYCGNLE